MGLFLIDKKDMINYIRKLTDNELIREKERIEGLYNDRINYATKTKNIRLIILSLLKISTENIFYNDIGEEIILNYSDSFELLNEEEINLIKGLNFDKIGLGDIKIRVELNK